MTYQAGQKLGNYRLTRLLGSGGFAEVYLARHIYLQTQAAIKVLQIHLTAEALQNFLKEARIIANLEHPNIVRVLEFGIENDRPYLVMNYAPNGTLRQRYPRGQVLAATTVQALIKQVVAGLYYAHSHKIIHRDIKPENMLLSANHIVLLSDFGLALEGHSAYYSQPADKAGTLVYMAPEQFRGNPCSASDQYSLGVVAYEWLSGGLPFSGTGLGVAVQHAQSQAQALSERVVGLPGEISNVVMRALRKDPQERYACIQDFADAFSEACQRHLPQLSDNETEQLFSAEEAPEQSSADTIAQFSLEISQARRTPYLSERMESEPAENGSRNRGSKILTRERSWHERKTQQIASQQEENIHTSNGASQRAGLLSRKRLALSGAGALLLCLGGFWGIQHPPTSTSRPAAVKNRGTQIVTRTVQAESKTAKAARIKPATPVVTQENIQADNLAGPGQLSATQAATVGQVIPTAVATKETQPAVRASPTSNPGLVVSTITPTVATGHSAGQLSVSIGSVPNIVQNDSNVAVQVITNTGNCQVSLQVIYSNDAQSFKSASYRSDSGGNATIIWAVNADSQSVGKYTLATLVVSARDEEGRTAISVPSVVSILQPSHPSVSW